VEVSLRRDLRQDFGNGPDLFGGYEPFGPDDSLGLDQDDPAASRDGRYVEPCFRMARSMPGQFDRVVGKWFWKGSGHGDAKEVAAFEDRGVGSDNNDRPGFRIPAAGIENVFHKENLAVVVQDAMAFDEGSIPGVVPGEDGIRVGSAGGHFSQNLVTGRDPLGISERRVVRGAHLTRQSTTDQFAVNRALNNSLPANFTENSLTPRRAFELEAFQGRQFHHDRLAPATHLTWRMEPIGFA
jgi:hypothetical protein